MWVPITEADLLTVLNGQELAGLRAAALGAGQSDPVAPTLAQVAELVRGYVASAPGLALDGRGGYIPARLLPAALDILASRIPQRVGQSPSAGRKAKEEAALVLLRDVAAGRFQTGEAGTPSVEASGGAAALVEAAGRATSRRALSGL